MSLRKSRLAVLLLATSFSFASKADKTEEEKNNKLVRDCVKVVVYVGTSATLPILGPMTATAIFHAHDHHDHHGSSGKAYRGKE